MLFTNSAIMFSNFAALGEQIVLRAFASRLDICFMDNHGAGYYVASFLQFQVSYKVNTVDGFF